MDLQSTDLAPKLCRWAEETIRHGRSPFRRAEVRPPLLTSDGATAPPLVLWINRDSFMAGGVIFFPDGEPQADQVAAGRDCAQALGLRHFVTWGPREVVFWEDQPGAPRPIRSLPLGDDSPSADRGTFDAMLEQLKLLSVLGAVAPDQLSPYCLANLCRQARDEAIPSLVEALRIGRGEGQNRLEEAPAAAAAQQQATLVLLRLLALLLEDRLPPAVQPEGLGQAIRFSLDTLPANLAVVLGEMSGEIPLPAESAIRFHHLFRRLLQLRLGADRQRADSVLEILLTHDRMLGGFPIDTAVPLLPGTLLLNPERLVEAEGVLEVGSSPFLAIAALLRHLRALPPAVQSADLFALADLAPPVIRGGLSPAAPLPPEGRRAVAVRLRRSWPHRRFSLPADTPRWGWEFLHLLGLAPPAGTLDLDTPDAWLTAPFGRPLLAVLAEHFTIEEISRRPGDRLACRLRKEVRPGAVSVLAGAAGRRELTWDRRWEEEPARLALALDLPEPVHALVEGGALTFATATETADAEGIHRFSRSTLGQCLWRTGTGGRPLPTRRVPEQWQRHGLPLPPEEVLHELARLPSRDGREPAVAELDAALAHWCGDLRLISPAMQAERLPPRRRSGRDKIVAALLQVLQADGLPVFPEHYLFAHYRPELREYRFAPPLTAGEAFFGRIVLRDRVGIDLCVEGRETARALVLASYGEERPIQLPVDQKLTAAILDRYLADLHRLRATVVREAHRRLDDAAMADRLVEEAWGALPLPPWSIVLD